LPKPLAWSGTLGQMSKPNVKQQLVSRAIRSIVVKIVDTVAALCSREAGNVVVVRSVLNGLFNFNGCFVFNLEYDIFVLFLELQILIVDYCLIRDCDTRGLD
jgi:hypothetical protein